MRRVGPERQPSFPGEIYQKIPIRYVFMAEELLRRPERDADAIERADQMTSRVRLGVMPKRSEGCPATWPTLKIGDAADHGARGARRTPPRRPGSGWCGSCPHATIFSRGCAQKAKNQLQQSRDAPNVAIEARENSPIDNRRRGRA
jgi:hypothetical protein